MDMNRVNKATRFYRSQLGEESVINYSHTDFPGRLFAKDVYYFFVYCWALPWVLWPLTTSGPFNPYNELAPTLGNAYCILIHAILIVLQVLLVISLPLAIFFPIWTVAAAAAVVMSVNWLLSRLLNGPSRTFHSDEKYAKALPEHEHEQWVFLNGVAVGSHWMQSNLNRLALTFGRPILGIHNPTSGIVFDVFECLVQRNFGYATDDVRIGFKVLREILYDPRKSKVIFILHSQGAIEGGLVLDWLLQELPQDLLAKLEVYTFGSAANHFNNPHRHVASQNLTKLNPLVALRNFTTETSYESPTTIVHPDVKKDSNNKVNGTGITKGVTVEIPPPSLKRESSSVLSTRSLSAAKDRAIGHVEHYAHSTDFVAIWGILHFATNAMGSPQLPRFLGRLFVRSNLAGGHQFSQHYLDGMFPLKFDAKKGEYVGAAEQSDFMNEVIKIGEEGDAMSNAREAFEITYAGTQGFGTGDISTPVEVHGLSETRLGKIQDSRAEVKVKDLSRLWRYRNGRSPDEAPPLLVTEAGVVRNATL